MFLTGKRGAAITFGFLGLLLAASIIAFPVYIYKTDQDYNKMFPVLTFGKNYLAKLTEDGSSIRTQLDAGPKDGEDGVKGDDPEVSADDKKVMDEENDHKKIYK